MRKREWQKQDKNVGNPQNVSQENHAPVPTAIGGDFNNCYISNKVFMNTQPAFSNAAIALIFMLLS